MSLLIFAVFCMPVFCNYSLILHNFEFLKLLNKWSTQCFQDLKRKFKVQDKELPLFNEIIKNNDKPSSSLIFITRL